MDIHGAVWTTDTKNGSRLAVDQRLRFGTAEFNRQRMQLSIDGKVIEVQLKPLEILSLLLTHSRSIVTRQMLFDTVWQGRPTVDNVLANAVSKLRTALGPFNAAYLITHPRIGYSLDCQVEIISSETTEDKIKTPLTVIDSSGREQPLKPLNQFTPIRKHNLLEEQSFFEDSSKSPVILSMSAKFKLSEGHTSALTSEYERAIGRAPTTNTQAHTILSGLTTEPNGEKKTDEIAPHNKQIDAEPANLKREHKKYIPKSMRKLTTHLYAPSSILSEQRLKRWQVAALLFFLIAASEYLLILAKYFAD